jgi:ATP-binding cassette subfamily B protein
MGFILDGLETEAYDRNYSDAELLQRIVGYFRPYARQMVLVGVMIALNSVAGTGGPILIAKAIDIVARTPAPAVMLLLAGGVLLLGVAAWGFNYVQQYVGARVVGNVVLAMREDVFNVTIQHDLSFFDEHPSGKIVSRVTSDTQDFSDVVNLVVNLISQVLLVAILAVWLTTVDVWLTLLLIAFAPLAVIIALSFRRVARTVTQRARRVTAKINAQIQESVSGIMVAKSFRQERAIYATFDANNRQAYQVGVRRGLTLNTIFPIISVCSGLGMALLVYAGGLAAHAGTVSPGNWYLFMQAVPGRPVGRRARLCPDRRRAESRPGRGRAGGPSERRHRVPPPPAHLHRHRNRAARLLAQNPSARDAGLCGPHRRRQEQHRPADCPLLRVPGRRAAHRRA